MPLFTSRHANIAELIAYFLATAAVGFAAGVILSVLQHWLEWGEFGVGVFMPIGTAILAGVCFVAWAVLVATARKRTTQWRR
jgi:Zn-dependent protease